MFRLLEADEIKVRVQSVSKSAKGPGAIMLLYKDARVDMTILDEVFTPLGWQRCHDVVNGNLFCTVSVWDESKQQWIKKQDVGTESNTEAEKGEASDAFKRACTNLGIGRELYTSPLIWVNLREDEVREQNGRLAVKPSARFEVKEIGYDDHRKINRLVIVDSKGEERFTFGGKAKKANTPSKAPESSQKRPKHTDGFVTLNEVLNDSSPISVTQSATEKHTEYITKGQAAELVSLAVEAFGDKAGEQFRKLTGYESTKKVPSFAFDQTVAMLKESVIVNG